jgi:DNA-binding Lrp family transcriptional regulator
MGPGQLLCLAPADELREVGNVHVPIDARRAVVKRHTLIAQQFLDGLFKTAEISQLGRVLQAESQRFEGTIEADDAQRAFVTAHGAQDGEHVGRRPEPNVPNNEVFRAVADALRQAQLLHIKRLGFGGRTDHRMKGFVVFRRIHAGDAVRQSDEAILFQIVRRLVCQMISVSIMDPLLKLLQENAALRPAQLAAMLNRPESEVAAQIKAYEADHVILGYRAILDEEKLGSDSVRAVIEVKITPERGGGFDRLAERIAKYAEVKSCYLMSGGYDLLVIVEGKNLREVASFVSERLATVHGVISTATHFLLKPYKEQGVLMRYEQAEERLAVTP